MKNNIETYKGSDIKSETSYSMICEETLQDIKDAMYYTDGLIIY